MLAGVVVVAAVGDVCARAKPARAHINAAIPKIFVFMAAELEEFSTE